MERIALIEFIQKTFPMPEASAEQIAHCFQEKQFNKNELLVKAGRICNEYYYLESGYCRAFLYDLAGNEITSTFYSPHQVVCELYSFFKRIPSGENIEALSDCTVWYLSFEGLQEVFHSMVLFREFGRTILINAYAGLKQRMLSAYQETAEQRYAHLLQTNPDIFQQAPLKQIASYLGVTDTSLSRIRSAFAKNSLPT